MHRPTQISYAALYSSKFVLLGVQLPFFSGWLHLKGLSAPDIGWITGAALAARFAFGPFLAVWADRRRDPRTGIRTVSFVFAAASMLLNFAPGQTAIAAASVAMLWSFGVLAPLADAAVLRADRAGRLNFGRTRAIGSTAFLLTTLLGGETLTRLGLHAAVAIMAAAGLSTFVVSLLLPKSPDAPRANAGSLVEAARLLSSKPFVAALAAAAFIQGGHAVYYAFSILHWTELGYSPRVIGALWAAGVVAEIALFMRMRGLVRGLGPQKLFAIGAAGAAIRWGVTALEPPLAVLFLVQTLHALSFAATYVGTIEFIDRAVPGRLVNTAMTINATAGVGAMTGLATIAAGYVYEAGGGSAAYLAMAAMAGVGLVFAVVLARNWNGKRLFE